MHLAHTGAGVVLERVTDITRGTPTMYDLLLSLNRRARRFSSFAVFGVALVAACDTDETVAPKPSAPAVPQAAQPQLLPGKTGSIAIKLLDEQQLQITGQFYSGFEIKSPSGKIWWATDNAQNDADSTWGAVALKSLVPGQYRVCVFSMPYFYGVVGQACRYPTVSAGANVNLFFFYAPEALFEWDIIDDGGNHMAGATFKVDSSGVPFQNVADNTGADTDPVTGKFRIPIRYEGKWTVCLDQIPAGYVKVPNGLTCATRDVVMQSSWGLGTFMIIPIHSAGWTVTDGFTAIGPSTFEVLSGAIKITVVDNGLNDYNPTLGKFSVKLPQAGPYSVCEIIPPVNHWNANPSCHRITVQAGVQASAGYFINPEKQVYYPGPRG